MGQIVTIHDADHAQYLRVKVPPITNWGRDMRALQEELQNTIRSYKPPIIGLAANQIRKMYRMIALDNGWVFCNPVVIEVAGETVAAEGCASLPGIVALVSRPKVVKVQYQMSVDGTRDYMTLDGRDARIFLHELDHLDGILITDKVVRDWKPKNLQQYLEARGELRPQRFQVGEWAQAPAPQVFEAAAADLEVDDE